MKVLKKFEPEKGLTILPIHYSADAEKDENWVNENQPLYTPDVWSREQEMNFGIATGTRCYANFVRNLHLDERLGLRPTMPLILMVDFNVEPMIWEIGHRFGEYLLIFDEIYQAPTNTKAMCEEFESRYRHQHQSTLIVYGDASGQRRGTLGSLQTGMSDIQAMKIYLKNYPTPIQWKVPFKNPSIKNRVTSVNLRLQDGDGKAWIRIHPTNCSHLVADMLEVIWDPTGEKIYKSYKPIFEDPYAERTHASDAVGSCTHYEWPPIREVTRIQKKNAKNMRGSTNPHARTLKYQRTLGKFANRR